MSDFRPISGPVSAQRCPALFAKSRPSSDAARMGLRYERRVDKEFITMIRVGKLTLVEHNSWFSFVDSEGSGTCSPDFIIHLPEFLVVVEVKLRWVPEALVKLDTLYCPVVTAALGQLTRGLVLCRALAPGAPKPAFALREAIASPGRLLIWPANGPMIW